MSIVFSIELTDVRFELILPLKQFIGELARFIVPFHLVLSVIYLLISGGLIAIMQEVG